MVCRTYLAEFFDFDWQFRLGEQGIYKPVQLPHDWSIELDFNEEVGPESGYLPGGIGYYKKDFNVPASYKGKRVSIVFDGIYHKATIYLNGQGGRLPSLRIYFI